MHQHCRVITAVVVTVSLTSLLLFVEDSIIDADSAASSLPSRSRGTCDRDRTVQTVGSCLEHVATLGCRQFCLLHQSIDFILERHRGNSIRCVEISKGTAKRMHPVFAKDCAWGHESDSERSFRANRLTEFLTESTPKGMHGVVLVETHDITTASLAYKKMLAALNIPLITMDARVDDNDVLLVPDVYYIHDRGFENLNFQVDNASLYAPWNSKLMQVRWRGASTGTPPQKWSDVEAGVNSRIKLSMLAKSMPQDKIDVAVVNLVQVPDDEEHEHVATALRDLGIVKTAMSMEQMMQARGIIDVDGNSNSWEGFWWKLRSNSVVLKVASKHRQWYYSQLQPWVHYVPISSDLSDLLSRVEYVTNSSNDKALLKIVNASTELTKELTYARAVNRTRDALRQYLVGDSQQFMEVHRKHVEELVDSMRNDTAAFDITGGAWLLKLLEHATLHASLTAPGSIGFRRLCGEAAEQLKTWRDCGSKEWRPLRPEG